MLQKIIFATNNAHKLKEIQHLIGDHFSLQSLKDIGFEGDIPETRPTLEGNALDKARFIYDRFQQPCFADDTGLEVTALNGEPGVYSARYAGPLENFGTEDNRSKANIEKVLAKLANASDRSARFRTVIAYIDGKDEYLFEGIVNGRIIVENLGDGGFGYDPVFIPEGYDQTFAQMPLSEKNKISHRARAFAKFVEFMKHAS
ncbi:MAG: RdgB/HAM1 family non-canonical purine NTP pyrophosphatase [Bacteroidota bacterium]|nr:RdgB/HAM1 family non-canonical purine NTP pyrophosphatase [Bacteroidota bacterium]